MITAPLDNFFMTLLFFLSGTGAYYSLQFRSRLEFMNERARKLLLPLVLGMISICPVQAYFKALYNGFSGGFINFLPQFFFHKTVYYLGYAHLWFLLYLFIFTAICAPLFARWLKENYRLEKIAAFLCRGKNIYIPVVFIILVETVLRPFFNGPYIVIMDWTNDLVYLSVFIFGFVFAADTKVQERINGLKKIAGIAVLICIPALIFMYYLWAVRGANAISLTFTWAFTKGVYECAAIIALIGIAKKYLNRKTNLITYLNKASFTYYYWHYLPVSILTYYFIRTRFNVYVKYVCVVVLSFLFIFGCYELIKRLSRGSKKRAVVTQ
jgi:hypothetical protein